ncbi:MAG TPA: DUF2231 domain-containing protein [Candidatus Sulfotelmatobacter sp.]|nr:DUF2231 domain-containing protein [Candidatus Sulfotelmatobacter sp.]
MDPSLYGFDGLTKAFNVHPAFVHFPIALLPVTLLFYACGLRLRNPTWLLGGRICLYLSTLSVIATVATGLIAQNTIPHNERIHHMMDTHRTTGLILLGLTVVLTLWSFWQVAHRPKLPWGFLLGTAVASYLVLQNGDLGSRMVYLEGAAVKPAVSVISDAGHEHTHAPGEAHHHHAEEPGTDHHHDEQPGTNAEDHHTHP